MLHIRKYQLLMKYFYTFSILLLTTAMSNASTSSLIGDATDNIFTQNSTLDAVTVDAVTHCNSKIPGWGQSGLGTISFYTNQVWTIIGHGFKQIWSDAVTATACQKSAFDGGYWDSREFNAALSTSNFNADCRSNPNFPGDLFSWCAVIRFAEQLCPYPWRVPTQQDFIRLDMAMGGTGLNRHLKTSPVATPEFVTNTYVNRWGGTFTGRSSYYGTLYNYGLWGGSWSQTILLEGSKAFGLGVNVNGHVGPRGFGIKNSGRPLRCVR